MIEVRARRVCLLETQLVGGRKACLPRFFRGGLSFWEAGLWDKIPQTVAPRGRRAVVVSHSVKS